jgi:hypothetical protein
VSYELWNAFAAQILLISSYLLIRIVATLAMFPTTVGLGFKRPLKF